MAQIKPPTNEQGSTAGVGAGIASWGSWTAGDDLERVVELQWPNSIATYHAMLNDAQIYSLLQGLLFPIRAYEWYLEPNGAPPEIVDRISADYNLPVGKGTEFNRRRGQRRFSFDRHLEDALRALQYGHYPFEQVGEILDGKWHLRKLGARTPKTISEIKTAADGSLEWIKQSLDPNPPKIGIDRLVWYVWDREGANWVGRSILRSVYRNHIVKDRVLRVGAINIERAGGVPFVEAPEGASGDQIRMLDELARRFRVGENSGAALPHGAQLKFASAANGDGAVAYIKLQNEEMARAFLQMVSMLGQTNSGSRALGDTFHEMVQVVQYMVAKWFADTFNEHVIEDDVEWNEGPAQEYAPLLKFDAGAQDPMAGFSAADGEDDGLQISDPSLRAQMGLHVPGSRVRRVHRSARQESVRAATADGIVDELASQPLPSRPLRRQPMEFEIKAAVDFGSVETMYNVSLVQLQAEANSARTFQIDELHDLIVDADGDLRKLSQITTTISASDRIRQALEVSAMTGIGNAVLEASLQGVDVPSRSVSEIRDALQARADAVDQLLKDDVVQAAKRQATRLTGGTLTPAEVADQTRQFLNQKTGAVATEILGGAIQTSMNDGRKLVYREDGKSGMLYASELLDTNTCSPCVRIDGTQYETVEEAERDYPTGGFRDCDGRDRCRGILLKVYDAN